MAVATAAASGLVTRRSDDTVETAAEIDASNSSNRPAISRSAWPVVSIEVLIVEEKKYRNPISAEDDAISGLIVVERGRVTLIAAEEENAGLIDTVNERITSASAVDVVEIAEETDAVKLF